MIASPPTVLGSTAGHGLHRSFPPLLSAASLPADRRGRLRNGARPGDFLAAPRCGARTRAVACCRQPAMANGRCRLHGGLEHRPAHRRGSRPLRPCAPPPRRLFGRHPRPHGRGPRPSSPHERPPRPSLHRWAWGASPIFQSECRGAPAWAPEQRRERAATRGRPCIQTRCRHPSAFTCR
jgi:hypothetical protein